MLQHVNSSAQDALARLVSICCAEQSKRGPNDVAEGLSARMTADGDITHCSSSRATRRVTAPGHHMNFEGFWRLICQVFIFLIRVERWSNAPPDQFLYS